MEVVYKGVWFICDNGYLAWSCTVPPDNNATSYNSIRFSEWLESMRKDVECLFGIMKGRFAILRNGFRFHMIEHCDQMWLTCCALHNLLLNIDGLDKNWENGVRSNWEECYTQNQCNNINMNIDTPFSIQRLNRDLTLVEDMESGYDTDDQIGMNTSMTNYVEDGKRIVSKMPLSLFRQCLINHFAIRFQRDDIVWPRHIKKP